MIDVALKVQQQCNAPLFVQRVAMCFTEEAHPFTPLMSITGGCAPRQCGPGRSDMQASRSAAPAAHVSHNSLQYVRFGPALNIIHALFLLQCDFAAKMALNFT